ncbi:hypothetical protein AAFC00_006187 [Neodothiora populina]|uniref:F-box domain-containing protein n=1 Tax=Neodothiora populina TaxID=2781224 RepID=A0ABR3P4R7_9PEZI
MTQLEFTIPEETLSWLKSIPQRPSSRTQRGPSRSSTYHEADSRYALRVNHSRRYSLATPPVLPPRTISEQSDNAAIAEDEEKKASLMDLPTEILDTIIGYAITPSSADEPVISVKRKETESPCTASDISSGAVVHKWHVGGYPSSLFLVNHTISAIAFRRTWSDSAVDISLSTADALCFLKYALSERQRCAMRRVRFPKFMLSWADPVGKDVWLRESRRDGRVAPGFVRDEEEKVEVQAQEEKQQRPAPPSRMQSLVGLLQTRSSPALGELVAH